MVRVSFWPSIPRLENGAQGRLGQLNDIRDLPPQAATGDESEGLPGEGTAPNASEALPAALGSRLSAPIHANAPARDIPIRPPELSVEADINVTSLRGRGDLPPEAIGFEAIRVSVAMGADALRKAPAALVRHTVVWSPVANTLHDPVHLDVAVAKPAAAAA